MYLWYIYFWNALTFLFSKKINQGHGHEYSSNTRILYIHVWYKYSWSVKTFTIDSQISMVNYVVKPRQIALLPNRVGGVNVAWRFEIVFLRSSFSSGFIVSPSPRLPRLVLLCLISYSTRTQCIIPCVLSLKIFLWLLKLSSSVLIFCCFSVIVVLFSGASVEHQCVLADVDEGDREQIKVESVLLS